MRSYQPFQQLSEVDAGMPYDVEQLPVGDENSLAGKRIAIVCSHGFEEIEVTYPIDFFEARGAKVDVIAPWWINGEVAAIRFVRPTLRIPVDRQFPNPNDKNPADSPQAGDYHAVVVPGGFQNPAVLRNDPAVLDFLREASGNGQLVASICHGPLTLVSAGLVYKRRVIGVDDILIDLKNAGAEVVMDAEGNPKPIVIDANLLTSRNPNTLQYFCLGIEMYLTGQLQVGYYPNEAISGGELSDDDIEKMNHLAEDDVIAAVRAITDKA